MSKHDKTYHDLLQLILDEGYRKTDRTGTGTLSVFGAQAKFDLREGFPLLTTKKMFTKAIVHELLWFITGSTNIKYLLDNGVHIWDEWTPAYKRGKHTEVERVWNETLKFKDESEPGFLDKDLDIGPAYGFQWRNFGAKWNDLIPRWGMYILEGGVDQLGQAIHKIRNKPDDRRIIVSAWDPATVDQCQLPPCHCFFQFNVHGDVLHLNMYQRSCDVFLGVPFNIASYALLLEMVAHITGLKAGVFTHHYGDLHIYNNHVDQVKEQLSRSCDQYKAPTLFLSPGIKEIEEFTYGDILFNGYESFPSIKAEVAV